MSKQTDLINVTDAITVSGSNVGIGTSSPSNTLEVAGDGVLRIRPSTDNSQGVLYFNDTTTLGNSYRADIGIINDGGLSFKTTGTINTAPSERMRIDDSGNLLVGQAGIADYTTTAGSSLRASGFSTHTADGNVSLVLNRLTSDGNIALFRKDNSTVGSIGNNGSRPYICSTGHGLYFGSTSTLPTNGSGAPVDNAYDLGYSSYRWDDVYATNGNIQTSDRNEKQDIAALTATEMLVAARISGLFKTFRWIDSVADKGDNARTHTGVIAQDVQAAFTAEGLDAGDYALFTSATWWETQTDVAAVEADEDNDIEAADAYTRTDTFDTLDEAPDGATERTRMGIRYPELLAFVGAYNEQRFASIETRLAALEAV